MYFFFTNYIVIIIIYLISNYFVCIVKYLKWNHMNWAPKILNINLQEHGYYS